METIIFVGEDALMPGGDFRLSLYHMRADDPTWHQSPLAQSTIPASLLPEDVPTVKNSAGEDVPLDLASLRRIVFDQLDPSAEIESVGYYLFRLLHRTDCGKEWDRLRETHERRGGAGGLRTVLDFRADALRELPWELACEPRLRLRPFSLRGNPVYRGSIKAWITPRRQSIDLPLRVLVVTGTAADDKEARTQEHLWAIHDALRRLRSRVYVHRQISPTLGAFREEIQEFQPHVLYFSGHGAVFEGVPALQFGDKKRGVWYLKSHDISHEFATCPLQLAFINACRSAAVGQAGGESQPTWAVTEAFRQLEIPIVIGMQADVWADQATTLTEQFYDALVAGRPVDEAFLGAREKLRAEKGLNARDWAMPVLHLSVPPHPMFAITPAQPSAAAPPEEEVELLETFVDRTEPRWQLLQAVDPLTADELPRDEFPCGEDAPTGISYRTFSFSPTDQVAVIVGEAQTGKTALALTFLDVAAARGRRVHYVDISGKEDGTADFLAFLRRIRDGRGNTVFRFPFAPDAFPRFHYQLRECFSGREPKPISVIPEWEPDPAPDAPWPGGRPEAIQQVIRAFREDLGDVARQQPVLPMLLVLDHLKVVGPDFVMYVVQELIRPIADGRLAPLRLVLVLERSQVSQYGMGGFRQIDLPPFPTAEFRDLCSEFCRAYLLRGGGKSASVLDLVIPQTVAYHETMYVNGFMPGPPEVFRDLSGLLSKLRR